MKKILSVILAGVLCLCVTGCSNAIEYSNSSQTVNDSKETSSSSSSETSKSDVPKEYSYDSLQNLFISITSSTTAEILKQQIEDKSLCYTSQDHNSSLGKTVTYVIAYSEGVAAQKYADSGDHLEVTFQKSSGTIMTVQYVNEKCSFSALYYNFGYWYDFSDREPGNYSGYYIVDPFAKNTGITIKYNNGNEKATNYFRKGSAVEAIQAIIDDLVDNGYSNNAQSSSDSSNVASSTSSSLEYSSTSEIESNSQPPELVKPNFRNTVWGMGKDEVKQLETVEMQYEEDRAILYNATSVAGLTALPFYAFDDVQKLYGGGYYFVLQHTSESLYIDDFYSVGDLLDEKYGRGKFDYEWKNDRYKDDFYNWGYAISIGDLNMVAVWETPETKIRLLLTGDNRQISLDLLYSSLTYKQVLNSQTDGL